MKREPVKSSNIRSIGYQKDAPGSQKGKGLLEIEFMSGSTYHYYDVEEHIYKQLMRAPSIGTYFAKTIKDSYKYRPV